MCWTNAAAAAAAAAVAAAAVAAVAAAAAGAGIAAAGKSVGAPAGGAGGAAETSRIVWFAASSVQHVCRIAAHALQDLYAGGPPWESPSVALMGPINATWGVLVSFCD